MKGKKGFTLVEIMIVVAIIGLLAAIAIPSLLKARQETQRRSIQNNLRIIADARDQVMTASNYISYATVPGDSKWDNMVYPFLDVDDPAEKWSPTVNEGIAAMNWPGEFPANYGLWSGDDPGSLAEVVDVDTEMTKDHLDTWLQSRTLAVVVDLGSGEETIHFERGR